jgi:hypothetical protein
LCGGLSGFTRVDGENDLIHTGSGGGADGGAAIAEHHILVAAQVEL